MSSVLVTEACLGGEALSYTENVIVSFVPIAAAAVSSWQGVSPTLEKR